MRPRRRWTLAALLLGLPGAATEPSAVSPTCPIDEPAGAPSPDLYCVDLLPTGLVPEAHAAARLEPAPSPFGVSVTAAGIPRWELELVVQGLPDPSSLGPFRAYVAWATTPRLDPEIRLGRVANGRTRLGPLALDPFLVLISAEPSPEATTRTGPLVLRGASAGTRLQPHDLGRVLAELVDPPGRHEAERLEGHAPAGGAHAHGHGTQGPPAAGVTPSWPELPMHPAVAMPRALLRLRPGVSPYLPAADGASRVPSARPADLVDLADGDTLTLTAGPLLRTWKGRPYVAYGFNGSWPGPLVRVTRGATIHVLFENRTEWPTTVHWHGVRLDNAFDGVPGVTQEPVPPGGHFAYRVRFPDAGLYWYHPHHRADVLQDLGLYGNILVGDPAEGPAPVHREEVLLLDDLLVGAGGPVPWGREAATHALMGRFGNVPLVNGEPGYALEVDDGAVVRFHLTNAANARVWNLSFSGAPMKVVATDLSRFEREERIESVVLAPAERYVVDVRFPSPGAYAIVNRVRGIDAFRGRFFEEADTLGIVRVRERAAKPDRRAEFEALRPDAAVAAEVAELREALQDPPQRELVLTLETDSLPFPIEPLLALESAYAEPVEWTGAMAEMNGAATARTLRWVLRDPATGDENEAIAWRFQVGERVRLRITNDRGSLHPMHHPIHVHGQRFLVLAQGGRPRRNLAWKDTLLLPAGDVAEVLLEVSNPGSWTLHCHTAEHLEAGMRTVFTVAPAPSSHPSMEEGP